MTLVGMGRSTLNTPRIEACGMGDSTPDYWYHSKINDANTQLFYGGALIAADLNTHVMRLKYDGTNYYGYIDNVLVATQAAAPGGNTTVDRGCFFGLMRTTIGNRAWATMSRVRTFTTPRSDDVAASDCAILRALYSITTPKTMSIANEGASMTDASRSDLSWSNAMLYGNDTVTINNQASVGATLATMAARAAAIDATYNNALGAGHNLLLLSLEANDVGLTGTGDVTAILNAAAAYISARKAVGWRVGLLTMIPHGQSAGVAPHANYLAKSAQINTAIRAGTTGHDWTDDLALTWPGGPDVRPDLYEGDWIHPSVAGAHLICDTREPNYRVQSLLAA